MSARSPKKPIEPQDKAELALAEEEKLRAKSSGYAAELLEELNRGEDTSPAQLLGSNLLAIKIKGVISTQCPSADRAIGRGGIPRGRLILLHGKEGCGKTTLALHCVAETQRLGGMAIFGDAEHKLDPEYAEKIGVDLNRLVITQPDYLEKFFAMIEKTIGVARKHRKRGEQFPILVVLDSIHALPTKEEFEADWEDRHYAPDAGIYSSKLKKLMPLVSREDVALLFVSQEREKIGVMFGKKERTGGGKAPRYYSSLILEVIRTGSVKQGEDIVGNLTQVKCIKNQIAPPFRKADFKIMFGRGIDYEDSLLQEAITFGIVEKSGAWYSYDGERIGHGIASVAENLRQSAELKRKIVEKVSWRLQHRQ